MLRAGDVLDRYVLLGRLASGGMGDVYLASRAGPLGLGPLVALKLLRSELQADPKFIEMLADEAKISMFLSHQNIVSVLDFAEGPLGHYLVMEFVHGATAQALVDAAHARGVRVGLPVAVFVASQVARALRYAHDRTDHEGRALHIVHRDVTPANILLSVDGEVKLTDFGIARARNRVHQTQAGVVKGKFGYLPPEAVRTQHMDRRADIFCAGVSLYLMATGRHPAADKTAFEAVEMYEQRQVIPPSQLAPEVPTALDAAIMRALDPDPSRRWPDAAAWERALGDALLSQPAARRRSAASELKAALQELLPHVDAPPLTQAAMTAAWERARPKLDPSYAAGTQPTLAPRPVDPLADSDDLALEPEPMPSSVGDRPTDALPSPRIVQTRFDQEPMLPDADDEDEAASERPLDDQTLADGPLIDDDQTWLGHLPPDSSEPGDFADRTFAGLRMPEDRDTQPSEPSMAAAASSTHAEAPALSAPTLASSILPIPRAPAPYFEEENEGEGAVEAGRRPASPPPPRPTSRIPIRPVRETSRARTAPGAPPGLPPNQRLPSVPRVGAPGFGGSQPPGRPPSAAPRGDPGRPAPTRRRRRRRGALVALAAGLLLAGGLALGMTSPVFWPTVELISRPPGAVVTVDGQPRGRTPTEVQVPPGPGPRVEFELADHQPAARALVGTVRRGRTYRMSVDLDPVPVLHVQPQATVSIGARVIGQGTRITLDDLPEGPIEVKVEAPGYVSYQRRFASADEVPSTWDVTLSQK